MRGRDLLFACVPLLCLTLQVRNQRNRFVALIATARQAGAEMTDRLRLLSSEQDILTAEVASKAQLLDKVHNRNTPWQRSYSCCNQSQSCTHVSASVSGCIFVHGLVCAYDT